MLKELSLFWKNREAKSVLSLSCEIMVSEYLFTSCNHYANYSVFFSTIKYFSVPTLERTYRLGQSVLQDTHTPPPPAVGKADSVRVQAICSVHSAHIQGMPLHCVLWE